MNLNSTNSLHLVLPSRESFLYYPDSAVSHFHQPGPLTYSLAIPIGVLADIWRLPARNISALQPCADPNWPQLVSADICIANPSRPDPSVPGFWLSLRVRRLVQQIGGSTAVFLLEGKPLKPHDIVCVSAQGITD